MTDQSKRKTRSLPDGDATETEINRKLTDHLRSHAIRLTADDVLHADDGAAKQGAVKQEVVKRASTLSWLLSAIGSFGITVVQVLGFAVIVVLLIIASIYAYFHDREPQAGQ